MKQRSKRLLSVLLTLAMLLGMVPGVAWAEGNVGQSAHKHGLDDLSASEVTFVPFSITPTDNVYTIELQPNQTLSYYLNANLNGRIAISATDQTSNATINLCLNGHKIDASGTYGSAIYAGRGVTLNLCDCQASQGATNYYKINPDTKKAEIILEEKDYNNLGADVSKGSFQGGYITGGKSEDDGGGVSSGTAFNQYGGTIIGNEATNGGGVSSWGSFDQYGGAIIGNKATYGGGVSANGTMTLHAGVISNNTAAKNGGGEGGNGGGVYLGNYFVNPFSQLDMKGGTISDNNAESGGGLYIYNTPEQSVISAGKITGNKATADGGGLWLQAWLNFTGEQAGAIAIRNNTAGRNGGGLFYCQPMNMNIKGAEISNNSAKNGGGIYNTQYGFIFANENVAVSGNSATGNGGGIYVDGGGEEGEGPARVTLRGGASVTNNTAGAAGGGVYVDGEISVGDVPPTNAVVESNTVNSANNNVYLASGKKILMAGQGDWDTDLGGWSTLHYQLSKGTNIGITLEDGTGVFTEGIADEPAQTAAKSYFFSDNTAYRVLSTVAADSAANQLKLGTVPFTRLEKLSITNTTENTRDGSGGESTYPQVGDTLRANATNNSNTPSTPVTYRWYRADSKDGPYTLIEGATEENYTATAADADKFLKVVATQSEDGSGNPLTTLVTKEAVIGPVALRNAPEPFAETHPTYPTSANGQITKTHADVDIENYGNLYYFDDNGKTWKKVQTNGNASAANNLPVGTYLFSYRNSDGSLPESKTTTVILTPQYDLIWLKLTKVSPADKMANEVGATIRAETNFGDGAPAGTALSYKWYRIKEKADGTIDRTELTAVADHPDQYTITAEDAGCKILAEVTWTYNDGQERTKTLSTPTPIIVSEPPAAYSVSGKVEKPDSNDDNAQKHGVPNATVELRQGNTVIATATTDENGNYRFNNTAPNGEYNIVVTTANGKTTKTERVTVNGANASVNVLLPYYNVSSLIVVQGNTPAVVIGSLDGLAKTESAGIGDNQSIEVKLTVEGKKDLTNTDDGDLTPEQRAEKADQTDVKDVAKSATGADTVVEFLDMGIVKATTSGDNSTYQVIRDTGTIVLNIRIPYLTEGRYQFGIYRKHVDGSNQVKTIAFQNKNTREDGTFEVGKGYLDVYATKFSTYAIGYTTTPPNNNNNNNNPGSSGGGGGSSFSGNRITVNSPVNGTAKTDRSTAYSGTRVTVTATPNEGYQVGSVTVTDKNGYAISVTKNSDGTYSFNMPTTAVTVNVSFVRKTANPTDTGVSKWLNTVDHILYIRGYNENGVSTVRPDNNITRAEAAMMFYRLLKDQNVTVTTTFTDVSEGQWYAQPIGVLASLGIVGGYGDGTFLPNRTISRAEFAKIATKFATLTGGKAQFKDVSEGHWANGFIATAADYGWIGGYEDGSYRPESFMTRAAAAKIINHMLGRAADREYVLSNRENLVKYTDLTDSNAWYYFELVEASVAHDFTVTDGVEKWK